jgi:hypothetical protein
VGVSRRPDRGPALLRRHQLERGPASLVGPAGGLGRWPRNLGRDRLRHGGRHLGHSAPRRRHPAVPGRCGARAPRSPVDRTNRQLLQPGALRRADLAALGAGNRPGAPPPWLRGVFDLSPLPSLTRSSGTYPWLGSWSGSGHAAGSVRRASSPCMWRATRGFGSSRRRFESILRTTCSGSGSTCTWRGSSAWAGRFGSCAVRAWGRRG